MSHFFLFLIAILIRKIDTLGCEKPNIPKFRVFDSFEQYRGNKVPFSPSKDGWQGSNVAFTMSTITTIPKNSFQTYDSESIIGLKLSNKQIKEIEDGAFKPLLCLEELLLDGNNITKLSRNFFPNKLRVLDLSRNKIEVVTNATFANLIRLRSLNLESNGVKSVEVAAFINLTLLEYLNLGHNKIGKILDDVFRPLPSLTTLILSWNKLKINARKWSLPKLQNLELAGTNLSHFDPAVVPFATLKSLNLSSNFLTVLNVTLLKRHFPSLELVDLNNNPWKCEDLHGIVRELNASNIKIPPGNFSHMGINGVACGDNLEPPVAQTVGSFPSVASITSTTKPGEVCVDKEELERYVVKKIKENNEELEDVITSIRTFAILTFSLLWVFVIAEVLYRTSVCGMFGQRTRRRSEESHSNDVDFGLLHMKES